MSAPVCRLCGTPGPEDAGVAAVAGWTTDRDEHHGETRLCPVCSRRHVRDIESKLDVAWW